MGIEGGEVEAHQRMLDPVEMKLFLDVCAAGVYDQTRPNLA
jgi:hypothetical protein